MSDDKEKQDECKMTQTDSEGNINLCCCYILDQESQPLSNPENRKVCLKWKSKNDVDAEGAMKIRELPIHY